MLALLLKSQWTYIALVVIGSLSYGAFWHLRADQIQANFDTFKNDVKEEGLKAELESRKREIEDQRRKETADENDRNSLAILAADNKRLRDARPRGGFVPPSTAGSANPKRACFDREVLEGAIRTLDSSVQRLLDKGDLGIIGLNGAKTWAQKPQ